MPEATLPAAREAATTPRPLHELLPALIAVLERVRDATEADGEWALDRAVVREARPLVAEALAVLVGDEERDPSAAERRDLIDAWFAVGADLSLDVPRLDDIRTTLAGLVVRAGHLPGYPGDPTIPTRRALFAAYVELTHLSTSEEGRDDVDWEPALSKLIQVQGLLGAAPPAPTASALPAHLAHVGCGRHRFATEPYLRLQPEKYADSPIYVCQTPGCPTRVSPGQLAYPALQSWMRQQENAR